MREPMVIRPAGHYRSHYEMELDAGASLDDVKAMTFSHVAKHLRPGDRIDVWPEDRGWEAHLVVRSVDRLSASVAVFAYVEFEPAPEKEAEEFEVAWISPGAKFGVIRKADGERISSGHATRKDAATWIKSHIKAMAA